MSEFLIFMMGACLGSFLGLVVDRFPHTSIIAPRSHCSTCHHVLCIWDMIPIFSQLILGSRCRYCHRRLPIWYALFEAVCGFLIWQLYLGRLEFSFVCLVILGLMLSLYDLRSQSYPVVIWLIGTLIFLPFTHLNLTFAICLLLAFFCECYEWRIGSGDLLFLASISLYLPLSSLVWLIQLASSSALIYLICQKQFRRSLPFVPFLYSAILLLVLCQMGR